MGGKTGRSETDGGQEDGPDDSAFGSVTCGFGCGNVALEKLLDWYNGLMMWKAIAIVLVFLAIGIGAGLYFGYDFGWEKSVDANITSFDECVAAGNPVMESNPPSCATKDGKTFTQETGGETELAPDIVVTDPSSNQLVSSPLRVAGRAMGPWFFEANAGLKVIDDQGIVLGQSFIQAQGEWMTEEYVEFEGKVEFDPGGANTGEVVFENANPSGDPVRAKEIRIPVRFK